MDNESKSIFEDDGSKLVTTYQSLTLSQQVALLRLAQAMAAQNQGHGASSVGVAS